jgi:hypothetical protein
MKFSMLLAVILAAVWAASEAQSVVRPQILVAISVDQFSADLFTEYRPVFKAGLHRLQTGARALFETSAEVLDGLTRAFEHYEQGSERAFQ